MKNMKKLASALALAAITAGSAQAAVINIAGYSLVPDGTTCGSDNSNTSTQQQSTDLVALNSGNVLPGGAANSPDTVYMVTTITWGASSDAHVILNFAASGNQKMVTLLTP